jgi:cytochrome c peroxidase
MLRNIALTAPYMHDGRFETLEEVVEHYNSGIKAHPNLHFALRDFQTSQPKRLNLSNSEKQALVAFLRTLTDSEFAEDVRFSNPFDL